MGYLLGTLFTNEVGFYGIANNQPLLASLVYAAPFINGALMGVCIGWNPDLKKRASILILSGAVGFEIGSQLNRFSWLAMGQIFSNLGFIFPPPSDFVFLLAWIISSVVFGIVAGGLFGTAVGNFAQGRNGKINLDMATE